VGGLAQVTYESSGVGVAAILLYVVVVYAILVIPYWMIFTKAGREGWPALIPIYSTYILLKVIGRPGWWLILLIVPVVNVVIYIIMMNDLSKSFGHGVGFTLGLLFLSIIFVYILAFGSSTYRGAGATGTAMSSPPPPPMPV
jgi:Family of unknown function (DUF5684)